MNPDAIGECAGRIWRTLASRERVAVAALPKLTGADPGMVRLALGWLAREGKVNLRSEGRSLVASLPDGERG